MFHHNSIIPWGSFRGRQEEKWGSFRGQFGDHFRVGDHFGGCTGLDKGIKMGTKNGASKRPQIVVYLKQLMDTEKFENNNNLDVSGTSF